jgi:hypothetical protein
MKLRYAIGGWLIWAGYIIFRAWPMLKSFRDTSVAAPGHEVMTMRRELSHRERL